MERNIYCFLVFMYLKVPGQCQSEVPGFVSLDSILLHAVLALLVGVLLLCIVTVIGIFVVCFRQNKIWKKLSVEETTYAHINHHALQSMPVGYDLNHQNQETLSCNSRTATRPSSLRLTGGQVQGGSSENCEGAENQLHSCSHSSGSSAFKQSNPPDYEDSMARRAKQNSSTARVSQEKTGNSWSRVDLSSKEENWSHYVDMNACKALEDVEQREGLDGECVYDIPRHFSCTCFKTSSACLCFTSSATATLKNAKHSRVLSDNYSDQVNKTSQEFENSKNRPTTFPTYKERGIYVPSLPKAESKDSGVASIIGSQSLNTDESSGKVEKRRYTYNCNVEQDRLALAKKPSSIQKSKQRVTEKTPNKPSLFI
ncbi:hypothetical protein AOXY_G2653 [Acipenser oxyrinchus oxyrinchus]|uniref:Uncharacterized protein n=1 Tax=Acipenser oxyrinchus oxyrinchus TaxID=40147 RepID=A0AAD8GIT8_ACIOX|nr:hypothetical protein AOXY_G2653 [Acipenser oxyrinchus oxyrinchus]